MLSNSCRYGIRAVVYIASKQQGNNKTGIKQIARDLDLPTPFLAKILQQLAKQKILKSLKGPHGGFSLLKDQKKITMLDLVKTIDGDAIFSNCIIHGEVCPEADKHTEHCFLHDEYVKLRQDLTGLFENITVYDLVTKKDISKNVFI
jgi:Rrf2 family protein